MGNETCCLLGRGKLYIAQSPDQSSWGFGYGMGWGEANLNPSAGRFVGNVSRISLQPRSSQFPVYRGPNSYLDADGESAVFEGVDISLTLQCANVKNFVDSLYGAELSNSSLPSVVDELIESVWGLGLFKEYDFILFSNLGVNLATVVVKREDTSATLTLGTDYSVSKSGITILADLTISDLGQLKISYEFTGSSSGIESFAGTSKPVRLFLDGFNSKDTDDIFVVNIHRARLKPTTVIDLIQSDSFLNIELTGQLEADPTKENGLSQFFSIERINT